MNNTLESSKLFPYIAWTLVAGFAIFTYTLTARVYNDLDEISKISNGVERLEAKLDAMDQRQNFQ